MEYSLYNVVWIFFIYAFIGWVCEVAFAALTEGKFVNRGFLNGPVCPIYGCGMVIVALVLDPIKENPFILFIGSMLLTSVLEFITGFVLERFFSEKWWDYSNEPFNIKGYVCLKFSVMWGIACLLVMKIFHPMIMGLISLLNGIVGYILMAVFAGLMLADIILTVSALLKIRARLRLLRGIEVKVREASDSIGEGISKGVFATVKVIDEHRDELDGIKEKLEGGKVQIKERLEDNAGRIRLRQRQHIESLKDKFDKLTKEERFSSRRLLSAFPDLKSRLSEKETGLKEKIESVLAKYK